MRLKYIAFLLMFCCMMMKCNLPKDPNHSWEKTLLYGLKVGVVNNTKNQTDFEKNLMTQFADLEELQIKFIHGSESDLIKELQNGYLQIIIGGFEKTTNWKNKTGLTKPYDGTHVMLVKKGENELLFHIEEFISKQLSK